ncbi:A-kinase-interacting protein 1 isoform X3 [Heterocephalus glaber]|uniref:A-kinase-interacting protein 1 isoform X3 n=1 Tax=Heterocephalus glaber TaxID=10181 RepID=A0AAX6TEI2_HETGA|nr:A-kinase-interacting protein 1 isoform X3 [Heterocephalus glaber]
MAGRAGAARYKPPPSQDLWARAPREAGRANMENCLAAAALNGLDRRSLQRSARLGQEVLERARRRAVDWHLQERPTGSMGVLSREGPCREGRRAADPRRFLPTEREERHLTLNASFRIMAEFMDYTSSQCGRIDREKTFLDQGGIYRTSEPDSETSQPAENISKDLYIEVYPGTYSVTVASNALTKKTHVVAVDSGQSVDLVFPV